MSLNFPNASRSYDAGRKGIRFWGHDGALEISFLVELDAVSRLSSNAGSDEASLLGTFDHCRNRILQVATKLYARRRSNFYVLLATDF